MFLYTVDIYFRGSIIRYYIDRISRFPMLMTDSFCTQQRWFGFDLETCIENIPYIIVSYYDNMFSALKTNDMP